MSASWKQSRAADALRCLLRPAWLRTWRQRRALRHASPTAIVHPRATVEDSSLGRRVLIDAGTWVYGSELGDFSYVADGARLARTQMGRFCSVGPRAYIGLPQHPSRGFLSSHPVFYQRAPGRGHDFADRDYFEGFVTTTVGNDVWIGAGAMIKSGLTIGDGAIVGAGAVVTRDVPPFAVCTGVPARVARYRFTPEQIAFLLQFCWWDKSEAWLREHWREWHDADAFIARHGGPPSP